MFVLLLSGKLYENTCLLLVRYDCFIIRRNLLLLENCLRLSCLTSFSYDCSKSIERVLFQMYISERFQANNLATMFR